MSELSISILHLASDEKFIDAAIYIFEKAFPGCNHFVIPKSRYNGKLVYVKKSEHVEITPYNKNLFSYLSGLAQAHDCVLLHGITELNSTVFLLSGAKDKFVGILWGAELYTKENFSGRSFMGELTSAIKLSESQAPIIEMVKDRLRKLIYKKVEMKEGAVRLAANELRCFGYPIMRNSFFFSTHNILSKECRFIPFTYYPLEYIIKGIENLTVNGNNILVGNSANYSNNHLEAFKRIEEIGLEHVKLLLL